MIADIFSADYWAALRQNTIVNGFTGRDLCNRWCVESLEILVERGVEGFSKKHATRSKILVEHGLSFHIWLEANHEGRRFIADGTAGQINLSYPLGFYGYLEQAPPGLASVYKRGKTGDVEIYRV